MIILGTLDVEFDENGVVIGQAGELIKIADKKEDAEVAKVLKGYSDQIAEVKNDSIRCDSCSELLNPRLSDSECYISVSNSETNFGNLITDGMLDKAKEFNPETVIALQNGGGIRAPLTKVKLHLEKLLLYFRLEIRWQRWN